MGKSKRRNKQYNPRKRLEIGITKAYEKFMDDHMIVFFGESEDDQSAVKLYCISQDKLKDKMTQSTCDHILGRQHQWSFYLGALCNDGKHDYIKSLEVSLDQPVYEAEMFEFLNQQHELLLKDCNSNHLRGFGWIAYHKDYTWDDATALELFKRFKSNT